MVVAGMALFTGLVVTGASAQVLVEQEGQILYSGAPIEQSGLKVGSWGGGVCKEATKNGRVLEITPKGLYQGGRIDFQSPVDISSMLSDRDAYIQIMLQFGTQDKNDRLFGGMMMPGMPGGMPGMPGGMPGMPGMPGMTMPGMGGVGTSNGVRPNTRIQIMMTLDSGEMMECQSDLANYKLSEEGQMPVSFPFAAVKAGKQLTGTKLKRLVICADGNQPFSIQEIRTVHDSTPLRADAGGDKEASKNYKVVFQGYATVGASAARYSWDFDASDGIQEEAVGDLIQHRFRKASDPGQDFVVTLTVSDPFGTKEPVTSTAKVRVNE